MILICSYCGSECNERDQANGRCGSCACFFTGNEEVVVREDAATDNATPKEPPQPPPPPESPQSEHREPSPPPPPDGFNPDAVEPDSAPGAISNSEGLIQPRRLSPQFRRRVEMTWQSTFGGGGVTAEHTLNSASPSTETKSESPTLSIATRRITRSNGDSNGAKASDYQLDKVIGEGSMGKVWSARQTSLDRNVAVKVPRAELAGIGSVGESQFISEVVVTGKLEHPNIVPIYELGRDSTGLPFYSMKHVQGRPWNEFIGEKTIQENLEILMKVCDAIAFAHDRNFLHRDIKPHNVMVGEFGEVSVMDWGIAVSIKKDPDQPWASVATGPAGTPAYMAPEMAAHNPSELGIVSDVYLLGAVLYEIVTGTPPHPKTGDTGEALLSAAANEIIPTEKTGELVDIARRAMATKLDDRFQSVKELQDALREYQSHRESITLSESADQHHKNAKQDRSSDEFARARFAYEEALRLWDGNSAAAKGLKAATIAHAQNALEQENFELGISILDSDNPDHRELLARLVSKKAARQRLASFSKIAAATAAVAILLVAAQQYKAKRDQIKNAENLSEALDTAESNLDLAIKNRNQARRAEVRAVSAKNKALDLKREARRLEGEARLEKRRAEEAPYASEIGLAAEAIRGNLFDKAGKILDKLDPTVEGADPVMSEMRHIEWGLLKNRWAPASVRSIRQNQHIESVASSSDGSVIVAGDESGTVLLWQKAADASQLPAPKVIEFGESIRSVAVSRDGRYFAAAGIRNRGTDVDATADFDVLVWKIDDEGSATPLPSLRGHRAEVLSVAFSGDSGRIVTSAADRFAIVWETQTGRSISVMPDHLDRKVWDAQFSGDARHVVTACEDGRVRVWEIASRETNGFAAAREAKKIQDFRGHDGPVYAATFTPDDRWVVSGGYDRRLLRWAFDPSQTAAIADSADRLKARLEGKAQGQRFRQDGENEIGDLRDRHTASIRSISVTEIGGQQRILSGANDNTVRLWTQSDGQWQMEKVLSGHGRWVRSCVFTDDGQTVLSGAFDGIKLWAWKSYSMPQRLVPDTEGRLSRQPSELGISDATESVFSRDGRWVATTYSNGTVQVWDMQRPGMATGNRLVEGHAMLAAIGEFFDGGRRLLTSAGDNTTRLWDVPRGTHAKKLSGTGYRGTAAVSWRADRDTALIVTGSDNRMTPAWLWKVSGDGDPEKVPLLEDHAKQQLADQVSNDNPAAATSETALRRIADTTAVTFSSDGNRFAVGDSQGRCFVFDVDPESLDGRQRIDFRAHGSAVDSVTFLSDGSALMTSSVDGQLMIWDVESGEQRYRFPWSGPVTSVDLSDDETRLLVGLAPEENAATPVALLYRLDAEQPELEMTFSVRSQSGTRDWSDNQPTVRSVQILPGQERALVTLFFPASGSSGSSTNPSGYQMGYWSWNDAEGDYQQINASKTGEIASATLGLDASGSQLLVVGGKGARLLRSEGADQTRFPIVTKSFRPSTSILSADFSFDRSADTSERLVIGDSEGTVRVWQLLDGRWTETSQAAVHLAGMHDAPIIATQFDPSDASRMLTADAAGVWKVWRFDGNWSPEFESRSSAPATLARFAPDGRRVLIGTDEGAEIWRQNDQRVYERDLEGWAPGKIASAEFSRDGSWIVTSDGDRNVNFWDAMGNRLARMNEEDATGTTSMSLSHDRRRMVCGQDKRVVIWDTSDVLEVASGEVLSGERIRELFTLNTDNDITSVSISPNGRNLLASALNGETILWQGEAIRPITIAFPNDQWTVQRDGVFAAVGASAVVSDPSRSVDYSDVEVRVKLLGDPLAREEFSLRPLANPVGESLVTTPQGETVALRYQNHHGAEGVLVGEILPPESATAEMRIRLNRNADSQVLQSLLRSLAYRVNPSEDSTDSKIKPTSLNAVQDDTAAPIDADEMAGIIRELSIKISGLRYRSVSASGNDTTESGDVTVERTILIEVEPEASDDQPISDSEIENSIATRLMRRSNQIINQ